MRTILYVALEATATYKIMYSLARELELRKWLRRQFDAGNAFPKLRKMRRSPKAYGFLSQPN